MLYHTDLCDSAFFIEMSHFMVYYIGVKRGWMYMGMAKKIRVVLLERNMTIKELAEKLGTNGNNLSNKLARDNFPEKELVQIADALGCDFEADFVLRDTGKRI